MDKWKLKVGIFQFAEVYEFTEKGRKYTLIYNYWLSNHIPNKKNELGRIQVIGNKRSYEFDDYNKLNEFLEKRKLPKFIG
jgi:hypothetical protein